MSDPITAVVTVVTEHPQAAAAVASVYGVVKPFLARILGPGADELGEIGRDYIKGRRAKNTKQTLVDADKLLAEVGREAQPVPLATVVPLLEGASLQEEPTLAAKWAALLANAADPAPKVDVNVSFVEILRQLGPVEVKIIDHLYAKHLDEQFHFEIMPDSIDKKLGITQELFEITATNLLRLQLCELPPDDLKVNDKGEIIRRIATKEKIWLTVLGKAFLAACTPPTP